MRRVLLALAVAAATPVYAQDAASEEDLRARPNWTESSLQVGGTTRWYRTYRPGSLPEKAPVVLLLHGGLQSMRVIFAPRAGGPKEWVELAEREGFLLVVPNGTNHETSDTQGDRQGWNDGRVDTFVRRQADDVEFLSALLDQIERTHSIDRSRAYVTGASNGGMMTYRLLAEVPHLFAAGAAFIANLPVSTPPFPRPDLPTPLIIINATLDPVVKWEGGEILKGRGFVVSTADTVSWWVEANRADSNNPVSEYLPDLEPSDNCRVLRTAYPAGQNGAPVVLMALEGSGHVMPSGKHGRSGRVCRDIEGAALAWEFMKTHRRLPRQ